MVEIYKLDETENNMEKIQNIQNINNNIKQNKTVVCAVYMPGCHHCTVLKPIWDDTMDEMSSQPLDGILASMNMDVPQKLEYEQQPIRGFPHIMALKGGKMITYEKQRSKESLVEFIKEHLGGKHVGGMKRGRRMRNRSGNKKTKQSRKSKKTGKSKGKTRKNKGKTRKSKGKTRRKKH